MNKYKKMSSTAFPVTTHSIITKAKKPCWGIPTNTMKTMTNQSLSSMMNSSLSISSLPKD